MKQQLIDRNECIRLMNKEIDKIENTLLAAIGRDPVLTDESWIKSEQIKYIRSEIIAKMPIVEEREVEE